MPHLVDTQFAGAPETVLDAAQDAVEVVLVSFKLQDDIDDVFQHFRSGQGTVLVDVSDEEDGRSSALGIPEQRCGTFPDLCQ